MKKLMFAVAAVAAGVALADVTSANVVGYNANELMVQQYNMIAVPFEMTDGSGWQLNSSLSGVNLYADSDADEADQVQIWLPNEETYEYWYFRQLTSGTSWRNYDDRAQKFEDVYEDGCLPGMAFWYLSHSEEATSSVTFSGQVNNSASFTKDDMMVQQYNMLGSPFPIQLQLNTVEDVTLFSVENAMASSDADEADQIQIWLPDEETYEYWYFRQLTSSTSWRNYDDRAQKFEDVYEDGLQIGKAFWYLSHGEEAPIATFFNPIAAVEK